MTNGDERVCSVVRSFLERQQILEGEEDEQYATKFQVRSTTCRANITVYNSGRIVVGGKSSPLKGLLTQMKDSIEQSGALPGTLLPFEIDRFPDTIRERIPDCDPIIIRFVNEAIICFKAGSMLGAAFMLGASSEKAINIMISAYLDAFSDASTRDKLASRINNRMISIRYDEFKKSYTGCKIKPPDPTINQDLTQILDGCFQFCRITRNEVGHPQIVPDLDSGVILANMGHFITYLERIYKLIGFFQNNAIAV
ncbi:MAG: hypothetical protein LM513_02370 [Nitrospira sp.]|nr:hypothetical protein [Nitrospira sp.]